MNGYYKNIIVSYYKTIIKFIKRGRWIIRMEKIANQIIKYLDDDRTSWDDLDRMTDMYMPARQLKTENIV